MTAEQRRLAAILVADVVGYSRLMGQDESGMLAALKSLRQEIVDPAMASHGGRTVKTTGDGMVVEFASVVDALRCCPYRKRHPGCHEERDRLGLATMIGFLILLFHVLISPFKTQARLEAEIVLLRHQLGVLRQRVPSRPKLT